MRNSFDDQIEGQMSLEDLFKPPKRLFAVSRIFARARKSMNLAEQKTFVYALSELRFTEEAKTDCVRLDKKTLANILGIHSDPDHLSVKLFEAIKELPAHSYIQINEKDIGLQSNGFIVTAVTRFKNTVRVRFNSEYMGLFTGLSANYITMWSSDIFQMNSKRSVQFYEYLRQETDTREEVNSIGLGVKALKELFGIPKDGEGSYIREKGGFDRANFEKKVIQPLCDDLKNCKMIKLVMQSDGKMYEKVKAGNRVRGYRFYWTFSGSPAAEIENKKPRKSQKPQKKSTFTDFSQREYDYNDLERQLLQQQKTNINSSIEGEKGRKKKK